LNVKGKFLNEEYSNGRMQRHRLKIISALVVFIALGAAWSYGWWHARDFMRGRFEGWLASERAAGRMHECSNRTVGGYPFSIAINCDAPLLQLGGGATVQLASMKIIASAISPYRLTVKFGGPFSFAQNGNITISVNFKSARLSLRHDGRKIERFSLAGEDVAIDVPNGQSHIAAKHAELQLRPMTSQSADAASLHDFEIAVEAKEILTLNATPGQPMDIAFAGVVRGWPDWRGAPDPTIDEWRKSGGKVEVKDLRVKRNGGQLVITGETFFNDAHRAEGRFIATFVDSPDLLRGLIMQGENDAGAMFGPLLPLLGKQVEFEGRRATSLQLKVNNGVLSLGTMVLGEFPPLY
jgi:hypothetical protein